jgi:hypothetical protein
MGATLLLWWVREGGLPSYYRDLWADRDVRAGGRFVQVSIVKSCSGGEIGPSESQLNRGLPMASMLSSLWERSS